MIAVIAAMAMAMAMAMAVVLMIGIEMIDKGMQTKGPAIVVVVVVLMKKMMMIKVMNGNVVKISYVMIMAHTSFRFTKNRGLLNRSQQQDVKFLM